MRFDYCPVAGWPPLAWLAKCDCGAAAISIFHGPRVETTPEWFCEGVWAGDYETGDLDRTDLVAGSGGRARPGEVVFVSSGSAMDRLHALCENGTAWVSNSLPCLLGACGGMVDAAYPHYHRDIRSIRRGLHRYKRTLPTSAGPVELVYFSNLAWDGGALTTRPKPDPIRDFSTFDCYYAFLETSLGRVIDNALDGRRQHALRLLGTISSGYDSATVATIAGRLGCKEILTFDRSYRGEDDSGTAVAEILGLQPIVVSTLAWRSRTRPEPPFIVGNVRGVEVPFAGADEHLSGRVLLTGNAGGSVWAREPDDLSEHLVQTTSGLSLTEYRLWTGFVHCAPAIWGARQVRTIAAISQSSDMAPWDVPGPYSRPICRRIVEQAGVPRELFGRRKRWATTKMHRYPESLTPDSWKDYAAWLRDHWRSWTAQRRIPPAIYVPIDRPLHAAASAVGWVARRVGEAGERVEGLSRLHPVCRGLQTLDLPRNPRWSRRYFFPWALERCIGRYPRPF